MSTNINPRAIFLCGPISNALQNGGFDPNIRRLLESIEKQLQDGGFIVLSAHRQEDFGKSIPEMPEEVFSRDWQLAQLSSAMVAVLPPDKQGKLYRTDGTFIEIGWALALGKPLFIVTDPRATDRSYLLDGLLRLPACEGVFKIEEALKTKMLVEAVQKAILRECSSTTEVSHTQPL